MKFPISDIESTDRKLVDTIEKDKSRITYRLSGVGLAFVICLLSLSSFTFGQDTVTGAFQGDISNNQTGNPVVGAAVQITNEQTGVVYDLITDSKGRFFQGQLAPGYYQISVAVSGFRARLLRREIKVSLTGDVVPVPVSLEPESAATPSQAVLEEPDNIRVEINTTDARQDGSTRKDEITKIPLGSSSLTKSFDEVALLLPGVAPPPQTIGDVAGPGVGPGVGSAGQFSVNGLRSRANNFTVDGSDNNDEDIGVRRQGFVALIPQPIESIQEFQIITLLAPAQFGRNIGAQVNVVSRGGGNQIAGALYGSLGSNRLSARNFFDTANGNQTFALRSASGQDVFLDGQPMMIRNQSGSEDTFTSSQIGGVLGGAIVPNHLFYFVSGEYQKINATKEESFAVPIVDQRGPFGTGATGIFSNPFLGPNPDPSSCAILNPDPNRCVFAVPNNQIGAGLFSLFPLPNNPAGVYGENTFTQILPAGGKGVILSGRLDNNFSIGGRPQSLTGRYNFTDDEKNIPSVNEAVFSTVLSKTQTQNLSMFFNSALGNPDSNKPLFNQIRYSFGRTHLNFVEVRDREFLIPSDQFPNQPFLLNAPLRFNTTRPFAFEIPNTGTVNFSSALTLNQIPTFTTAETLFGGPLGQVSVAGFSSLGTDVHNFPQDRINKTHQIADEVSWRFEGHSLFFGADIRRTDLDSDLPRLARPLVTFNGVPRLIDDGNGGFRFPTANDPNPIIRPEDLVGFGAASNFLLTLNVDRPDSKVNLRYYQFNFYGQDTWRIRPNLSISYGLRYEYNSPINEVNGLIEETFTDQRLSLAPGLNSFINGRTNLYEPDRNNFAPRIGIAFSPRVFGSNQLSVFRAGYGVFYDQILGAVANQSRNVFPTFLTLNFAGLVSMGLVNLQYRNPIRTEIPLGPNNSQRIVMPGTINILNPAISLSEFISLINSRFPGAINATLPSRNLEMPMAHHYSFIFEQQLSSNFTFSVGYVGTSGRKLIRFTTPNLGPGLIIIPTLINQATNILQGGGLLTVVLPRGILRSPDRPVPGVGAINIFESTASSTYNSFQTQLQGRFIRNLNFQLSYTFSNVTDDVSDVFDLAGAFALPQNSFDLKAERGPANFDIPHSLAYNVIYKFPEMKDRGFLRLIFENLQVTSLGRYTTGQPFTVNSVVDVNLDGNLTDRLDTTQGIEETGNREQPLRLTTNNTLSLLAPFGRDGQIKRNSFRAGNVLDLNLSVIKHFDFGLRRMSLRADIFNFINRANFGVPVRLLEAPGFGRATNTITPGMRVQLAFKYEF